jgi:hypothetical protein
MSNNIIKRVLHANLSVEAIRIKNTTTTFGIMYNNGTMIFDESTTLLYICTNIIKPYDTLVSLINSNKITLLTPGGGSGSITTISSMSEDQLTIDKETTTPELTIITGDVATGDTGLVTGNIVKNAIDFNSIFDGNRPITREGEYKGLNLGTTNIKDFIDKLWFPFVQAIISIITSPTNIIVEIGTNNSITITGVVTMNEETIVKNGHLDSIIPALGIIHAFGANISYSHSITFNPRQGDSVTYQQYKAYTTGDTDDVEVSSSTKTIKSVFPYLVGISSDSSLSNGGVALYSAFANLLEESGTKVISLSGTGYIYFAYPTSYGDLTSIKDHNNFEQLGSFTKSSNLVSSTGLSSDWANVYYNIYKLNNVTSASNWNYTFYL